MKLDDFEYQNPGENEELDELEEQRNQRSQRSLKDRSDDIKDGVDKAKEFRDKRRKASEASKKYGENLGKGTGREAGKAAGKEAGKTAGKEAGKTAAKEGAKTAAKETGKVVAKEGAKTAAKGAVAASGVATAGVGTAVAAGIEVADRLNQIKKAIDKKVDAKLKENIGVDGKTIKRTFLLGLILLPIFFIFFFISAGTLYLASENTYADLYSIIDKREKRYAESGKSTKLLLLMTNDEINEILTKDYGKEDLSYKTYLKEMYKKDFDNFIPSDSNDPTSSYTEKIAIIEKYLKAGRENFNKITWKLAGSNSALEIKDYNLKGKDSIFTDPGHLKMPNLDKYKSSPGMTAEQLQNMYVDMVNTHLQHWVIPYALNIASQNNAFAKSVLEDMWSPIEVTLYELDRRTKTTTEKHYIKTSVTETTTTYYPGTATTPGSSSSSSRTFESDTRYSWTGYSYGNTSVSYSITKIKNAEGGCISIDEANPYSRTPVSVDAPYRHVPKLTYTEDLYNIIKATYNIKPINESELPVEKSESLIDENGTKIIVEIWDENLESLNQETKKYRVSYMSDEKFNNLGRSISRIEWYMDAGGGKYLSQMFPVKTQAAMDSAKNTYYSPDGGKTDPVIQGYSYDELTFGFNQIDKYYKALTETAGAGLNYNIIDIGDIPLDGFAWPVDLTQSPGSAVVGYIFGNTKAYGGDHGGIDIRHADCLTKQGSLTVGPNIIAAHDGKVTTASMLYSSDSSGTGGNQSGYGNVIKIQTSDGKFTTVYGHLSSISVTVGQEVSRGQVIGTMGTTGNSSGVHLHYQILLNGTNTDPLLYYITEPEYGSYPSRVDTPAGYYKFVNSLSSGLTNAATSGGMIGFLGRAEGKGPMVGDKYKAYDDGYGYITIGMGITWKDHVSQFNALGVTSMSVGTLVDKAIVETIEKQDIAGRVANIKALLASNGITDLKQYQLDALTSYHYNVGNINKFPAAWKTYGMTDGLWTAFFSKPVTAKGVVAPGLVKRRAAEWELFTTGNYNAKIYDR